MRKLFLMGFVALGLLAASCSDKDEVIVQQGSGDDLNGYLTLALSSPVMTRTDEHIGREPGSEKEGKINDVTVVLTDASGNISQVVSATMESANSTKKFSVNVGTYKVYALVNASGVISSPSGNIEQLISNAALADVTSGFKNGSFFMTNYRHSGQGTAGVDVVINAGDDKLVSVTVDRVAAKIVDKTENPTVSLPVDVTAVVNGAEVLGFVPLNINADFNLIQTWGMTNTGGNITLSTDVLVTPVANYLAPVTLYKTQQTNVDGTKAWENISTADMFVDSVYTTENRPPIIENAQGVLTAKRDNTTGVIYKVQAQLNGTSCSTFYTYNNKAYANLNSLGQAYGTTLTGKSVLELRGLGINVYEDGIMYYTYFVKDPNTKYRFDNKDYFGVFRNSVYRLNISKINSLGDDVPDDNKEPGSTIDPDDAFLKVELTVNDWVLNNINIEF